MTTEGDDFTVGAITDGNSTITRSKHQLTVITINDVRLSHEIVHIELRIVTVLHSELSASDLVRSTNGELPRLAVDHFALESLDFSFLPRRHIHYVNRL